MLELIDGKLENIIVLPLGLTDSLILSLGTECEFIITSDSKLADYARSLGIIVVDLVKYKNDKFKN